MSVPTAAELAQRHCVPCEGGVPPLSDDEVDALLVHLPGWTKAANGKAIRRQWRVKNFVAGVEFFHEVARLAEAEGHHPDLHLTGYREVAIEITTHAIGGLSENDFILASKIDALPIAVKGKK